MMILVNDLGVDPNEWFVENDGSSGRLIPPPFSNPLDSMPLATDNPRPEEEIADWFETLAKAEKSHAGKFQKTLESIS